MSTFAFVKSSSPSIRPRHRVTQSYQLIPQIYEQISLTKEENPSPSITISRTQALTRSCRSPPTCGPWLAHLPNSVRHSLPCGHRRRRQRWCSCQPTGLFRLHATDVSRAPWRRNRCPGPARSRRSRTPQWPRSLRWRRGFVWRGVPGSLPKSHGRSRSGKAGRVPYRSLQGKYHIETFLYKWLRPYKQSAWVFAFHIILSIRKQERSVINKERLIER